ncbi:MAG: DNA double-strand break repair nuclease NurA [Chloroflexota bacterium]
MLSPSHVQTALEAQRAAFAGYQQAVAEQRQLYEGLLRQWCGLGAEALRARLAPYPRPGALPTAERVAGRGAVLPFAPRWDNHQEARAWAKGILTGVTTVAVDGSQITPDPTFSVPVGAVQVGWFENPHDPGQRYVKDLAFEVLPPEALSGDDPLGGGFPDRLVNLRRFELECDVLASHLRRLGSHLRRRAGRQPPAVCFLDGSLIISFAAQLSPGLKARYVRAITGLLSASEETRVPLVGFVDTSYATDLTSALARLAGLGGELPSDPALLAGQMAWGQRSEALLCARDDRLFAGDDGASSYYVRVAFTYLKATAPNPPARLDLPAWLLDAGLLEWVVDVVRAEAIVGTGYPYAAEAADALSVITVADREQFYRVFQSFLAEIGVELRYARKAYSKRTRR